MDTIDCIGDFCPIPILKIKMMLQTLKPGDSFQVMTDHDCVLESIDEFLTRKVISYTVEEMNHGIFIITVKKV